MVSAFFGGAGCVVAPAGQRLSDSRGSFEWFSFASLAEATAHFTEVQRGLTLNDGNVLSRLRANA